MRQLLLDLVDRLQGTPVVVLADLVLDEFLHGEIARVSREAPVLILDYLGLDPMPGGGANAVNNVRALGGTPLPVGVVGDDEPGSRLVGLLERAGIDASGVVRLAGYATPTKTRVLAGLPHSRHQQVVRIDRGRAASVPPESAGAAAERAAVRLAGGAKAVLLSDYDYGLVTPESARMVIDLARKRSVPAVCDSRRRLAGYRGVTAATPNLEEAEQALGRGLGEPGAEMEDAGRRLVGDLECRALLITMGSRGMTLIEDGVRPFAIPVFGTDQVADVTGAGDTVIAVFTLALAAGATFRLAALLSNVAAGLVVLKRGTAVVTADELRRAIEAAPAEWPA